MEYHSAIKRNTFVLVLMRWMNVELIIQSKVSQPSPGDLPNPGIEPRSPALQADSLAPRGVIKKISQKENQNS